MALCAGDSDWISLYGQGGDQRVDLYYAPESGDAELLAEDSDYITIEPVLLGTSDGTDPSVPTRSYSIPVSFGPFFIGVRRVDAGQGWLDYRLVMPPPRT